MARKPLAVPREQPEEYTYDADRPERAVVMRGATVAENVLTHGTGALNIDACRVGWPDGKVPQIGTPEWGGPNKKSTAVPGQEGDTVERVGPSELGRWPANIVHDGSDEVVACFPEAPGQQRAVGPQHGAKDSVNVFGDYGPRDDFQPRNDSGSAARFFASFPQEEHECTHSNANDAESISLPSSELVASALSHAVAQSTERLALTSIDFPEPFTSVTQSELRLISATVTELTQSLERRFSLGLPPESITTTISHVRAVATPKQTGIITITISLSKSSGFVELVTFSTMLKSLELGAKDSANEPRSRLFYSSKADKQDRIGSKHPTVKPVDLMQWLCRLVTPPGGTVLDPFAGSGSTGEAAWREGFQCVLIEREPEYQADIAERLRLADKGPLERRQRAIKQLPIGGLFSDNDNGASQIAA